MLTNLVSYTGPENARYFLIKENAGSVNVVISVMKVALYPKYIQVLEMTSDHI